MLEPFAESVWEAEVDFVVEDKLPFALLGYEGFLSRWAVSFNGCYGYFVVEPGDSFHQRHPGVLRKIKEKWPHLLRP
jgi:hypothetical protein